MVENASGQSFENCLQERLLNPLHLKQVVRNDPTNEQPEMSRFYEEDSTGHVARAQYADPSYKIAGAGYASTASDLVRFADQILTDNFLSDRSKRSMFMNHKTSDGQKSGFGLGWRISHDDKGRLVYHQPGGGPGISAWLFAYPEAKLTVAVLANKTYAPVGGAEVDRIMDRFLSACETNTGTAKGYLGILLGDPNQGQLPLEVNGVVSESPASTANIKQGDILLELNGSSFDEPNAFVRQSSKLKIRSKAKIKLRRDGKILETTCTVTQNPWVGINTPQTGPGMLQVETQKNIFYTKSRNQRQSYDLYLPKTQNSYPILMWIHGGAWSFGKKEQDHALALRLAERGIGVALVNHRLSDESWMDGQGQRQKGVKMPEHIKDVAAAFAQLKKNIAVENSGSNQIFVGGHSSGAHLALLLATQPDFLSQHQINIDEIAGVVAVEGTYDIADYYETVGNYMGTELAVRHFQSVFGTDPDSWPTLSPTKYINDSHVPVLVVNGSEAVYRHYADVLRSSLGPKREKSIRFIASSNRVHANIIQMMHRTESDEVRDQIIRFLTQVK